MATLASPQRRLYVIAITGPVTVGKTLLCHQLQALLADCRIVSQDDYRTPHKATVHPIWQTRDTEDAENAVDWDRWRAAVDVAISAAQRDLDSRSPPLSTGSASSLRDGTASPTASLPGTPIEQTERLRAALASSIVVLLDGRLALYDPSVARKCDLALFVRDSQDVVRRRWIDQQDARESVNASSTWRRLVYPAHIRAHAHLFVGSDVERGPPNAIFPVALLQGSNESLLERAAHRLCQLVPR